jgi:small subunit ribosomal protein S20
VAGKAAPKKNPSALKRVRQTEVKQLRNQAKKSEIRTLVKKFEAALVADDKDAIKETFKIAIKTIDSAASKGIIQKNTASRKIAKIAKKAHASIA